MRWLFFQYQYMVKLTPQFSHNIAFPTTFHYSKYFTTQLTPHNISKMKFSASVSSTTATLLLLALLPTSIASDGYSYPHLRLERRSTFDSEGHLLNKRDDCTTQYGPTYVDCGYDGCYQPSLGEVCCADESGTVPILYLPFSTQSLALNKAGVRE
jgi:hypothetical protein